MRRTSNRPSGCGTPAALFLIAFWTVPFGSRVAPANASPPGVLLSEAPYPFRSAAPGIPPIHWIAGRADESRGTVTYVYDGDTVKVRLESGEDKRVRLIGVDTPEYNDPDEEKRLLAFLARRFAAASLTRKDVRLTFDRESVDAYGRTLAYLWTDERTMFNETLIREGFGFAYLKFPFDEARKRRFAELEAEARKEGRGVWRKGSLPETSPAEVETALGKVIAVRFKCLKAFERSRFKVLLPSEGRFEVLIPLDTLATFPGSLDYEGRTLLATGLVEDYRGQTQIMIGVPLQLRIVE